MTVTEHVTRDQKILRDARSPGIEPRVSRFPLTLEHDELLIPNMEQQTNKAHRPSQSGAKAEKKNAKGKEKQRGFNEKVRVLVPFKSLQLLNTAHVSRPLHQSRVGKPRNRVVGQQSATKLDYMCLLSIVHQTMSPHQSL